jgi:hypothetical protein
MRTARILAVLCIAAPAAALAQTSYSRAAVTGPVVVPAEPIYPTYTAPYSCGELDRQKAILDGEKLDYDRERDRLDTEGARLNDTLRRLDSTDTGPSRTTMRAPTTTTAGSPITTAAWPR